MMEESSSTYGLENKIDNSITPSYSVGMHSKWTVSDRRRGPGAYNPCMISTSSPSYSMGSRVKTKDTETWQRGPGSYDSREPNHGPAFSLGARDSIKTNHTTSVPGPGAYNVHNSSFTRTSAPSYSMGGRSRTIRSTFQSPGPGAYNIDNPSKHSYGSSSHMNFRVSDSITNSGSSFGQSTMRSSPAFSSRGRSRSHINHTPGPGSYNVAGSAFKGSPGVSIGSREHRFKSEKGSSPGPGAYNIPSNGRSAPSYTIAHKRHETSIM